MRRSACAHESENGRLTDIDVKAVEDGGAERRSDLRENAVEDGWNRVDTHGEERPVRAGIDGSRHSVKRFVRSPMLQTANVRTPVKRRTGDPDKDQTIDQERDRRIA